MMSVSDDLLVVVAALAHSHPAPQDALQRLMAAYRRDPQWSQGAWPGCDPDWKTRVIPDADVEKS